MLSKIFSTDIFYRWLDRVNDYVAKNSLDPVQPDLTEAFKERESVKDLLDNFEEVQQELLQAARYATPIQGDMFFEEDITNDGKWHKFILKWYSRPTPNARVQCPKTLGILKRHKDIRLAMVSCLEPQARIEPHEGPWRGSVRVHIGLKTPNRRECYIEVAGTQYYWMDGQVLAFDDTYEHYVWNSTLYPRIILFLDIERKMKTWHSKLLVWFLNRTVARLSARD